MIRDTNNAVTLETIACIVLHCSTRALLWLVNGTPALWIKSGSDQEEHSIMTTTFKRCHGCRDVANSTIAVAKDCLHATVVAKAPIQVINYSVAAGRMHGLLDVLEPASLYCA